MGVNLGGTAGNYILSLILGQDFLFIGGKNHARKTMAILVKARNKTVF